MKKIVTIAIFLFTAFVIFIQPIYFGIDYKSFWILSAILIGVTIYCGYYSKSIFPTILFFTIVHITRPVSERFTDLIHINFPGTYYLIPIIIFTGLILLLKPIRQNISWWTKDKIDKKSIYIIIGLSVVSGLALFIWGFFIADDLTKFIDNLPEVAITWIIINGVGFALLNSIAEEYLARGMLCNGLEKILNNKIAIVGIQALIFGLFHKNGFPGGLIGIFMVISWSLVLGIVRYRTKGLIGVLIGHFFADFTIYLILYGLK